MREVVFVCQHGGAKSVIAAEYFTRIANERGVGLRGISAGLDPYDRIPEPVVVGLASKGIDVSGYTPQAVRAETFASATLVVHFGCDIAPLVGDGSVVQDWSEVPAVSDGFERAYEAIVLRVEDLVEAIANRLLESP